MHRLNFLYNIATSFLNNYCYWRETFFAPFDMTMPL